MLWVAVTGANGAVGRAVLRQALAGDAKLGIVALVRSARAAASLGALPPDRARVNPISYADQAQLRSALEGVRSLVHLPGVLIERPDSTYESAHVQTTRAAAAAAAQAGVERVVLVSSVGADPDARNRFFRTKGIAEEELRAGRFGVGILRTPLLLGPYTEGARALRRETARAVTFLLGGGRTWHQPLDVDDLARAVLALATGAADAPAEAVDLLGPERLLYRDLVQRAAGLRGRSVRVVGIPVAPVRAALGLRTRWLGPGFSRDALEVILGDTPLRGSEAAERLGLELTPLDETLQRSLAAEAGS